MSSLVRVGVRVRDKAWARVRFRVRVRGRGRGRGRDRVSGLAAVHEHLQVRVIHRHTLRQVEAHARRPA